MESTNRKLEKKPLFFHHAVDMKQPYAMTRPCFFLKFQRSNRQNALAMDSAKGKTGEKGCMAIALWR